MTGQITLSGQPPRPLTAQRYLIGRGEGCDILLPEGDGAVSRRHALLEQDPQGLWGIVDLGSHNGTLINGQRLSGRQTLLDGDRIQVGRSIMTLSLPRTQPTVAFAPPPAPRALPTVAVAPPPQRDMMLPAPLIPQDQPPAPLSVAPAASWPPSPPASPPAVAVRSVAQQAAAQPAEWLQNRKNALPVFDCLASPWLRLGANILAGFIEIALLVGVVVGLGSSVLGGLLAGFAPQLGGQVTGGGLVVLGVLCLLLWLAYLPWLISCWMKGTTPAKKFLGLMVVLEDGTQAGPGTMFVRDVALKGWLAGFAYGFVAAYIPVIGGFLSIALNIGLAAMILADVNHQAWYDRLMHTYVVETSKAQVQVP